MENVCPSPSYIGQQSCWLIATPLLQTFLPSEISTVQQAYLHIY